MKKLPNVFLSDIDGKRLLLLHFILFSWSVPSLYLIKECSYLSPKVKSINEVCVLNSKGIQCVNIGDGVMDEHEVYERVLISDLEKNVAIINKILDNYLHLTPAST